MWTAFLSLARDRRGSGLIFNGRIVAAQINAQVNMCREIAHGY